MSQCGTPCFCLGLTEHALCHANVQWHPDVTDHDEEEARDYFLKLSVAYDVLSDANARRQYDMYGEKGLSGFQHGHASDGMWDEVRDWVRQNAKDRRQGRRERARAVAGQPDRDTVWEGWDGVPQILRSGVALFGDVVKYPLPEAAKNDAEDLREWGVGVVVGRNIDRGDAKKIPSEMLPLCEVEPLEYLDGRWRQDTIGISCYPSLLDMDVLKVTDYIPGGIGETGGWYVLEEDWSHLSPQHYGDEIMV
jgi:hypothetical protein